MFSVAALCELFYFFTQFVSFLNFPWSSGQTLHQAQKTSRDSVSRTVEEGNGPPDAGGEHPSLLNDGLPSPQPSLDCISNSYLLSAVINEALLLPNYPSDHLTSFQCSLNIFEYLTAVLPKARKNYACAET